MAVLDRLDDVVAGGGVLVLDEVGCSVVFSVLGSDVVGTGVLLGVERVLLGVERVLFAVGRVLLEVGWVLFAGGWVLLAVERELVGVDELDRLGAGFVTVVVASSTDEVATLGGDDEAETVGELLTPPSPGTVTVGPVGAVTELIGVLLTAELPAVTELVGPAVAAVPQATAAGASKTRAPSSAVVDSRDRRRARIGFTVPGRRPSAASTRRGAAHQ